MVYYPVNERTAAWLLIAASSQRIGKAHEIEA